MKALTMYQPHASLEAKRFRILETRSWGTEYRGPLAIHAGRKVDPTLPPEAEKLAKELLDVEDLATLPTGAVLATAQLVDCHPITQEFIDGLSEQEFALGDFTEGRFAWEFQDIVELPTPVAALGKQKLWDWDETAGPEESPADEDADMVDEGIPLTLEGEAFSDFREMFNDMMANTLASMEQKDAAEADISCKLKIELDGDGGWVLPKFEYKITSVIPTKETCSGKMRNDARLVFDAEEGRWVLINVNHGQTSLFNKPEPAMTTTVDPSGVVTNVEFGAVREEDGEDAEQVQLGDTITGGDTAGTAEQGDGDLVHTEHPPAAITSGSEAVT